MEQDKLIKWLEKQPDNQLYAIIGKYKEDKFINKYRKDTLIYDFAAGSSSFLLYIPFFFSGNYLFREENDNYQLLQELSQNTTYIEQGKKFFSDKKIELQNIICTNEFVLKQIDKKKDDLYTIITLLTTEQNLHRYSVLAMSILVIRYGLKYFCSTYKSEKKEWEKFRENIIQKILNSGFKKPILQIKAFNKMEHLLQEKLPEYIHYPLKMFNSVTKEEFKNKYAELKGKNLSNSDKSVINEIYKHLV